MELESEYRDNEVDEEPISKAHFDEMGRSRWEADSIQDVLPFLAEEGFEEDTACKE